MTAGLNLVAVDLERGRVTCYARKYGASNNVRRLARIELGGWNEASAAERKLDLEAIEDMRANPELYSPELFENPDPPAPVIA